MKLFEIARMPDPSDFRVGDAQNSRSPDYRGASDDEGDPLPEFLDKQPDINDAESDDDDDDGASAIWKIDCGSQQQAQAVVGYLQQMAKRGAVQRLETAVSTTPNDPRYPDDQPSFIVTATYRHSEPPHEEFEP